MILKDKGTAPMAAPKELKQIIKLVSYETLFLIINSKSLDLPQF